MRRMYDDVTAADVPADGDLYAGYDDGNWPDAIDLANRFPGKTVVRITTNPAHDIGVVLDVESGDATPADAPGWCQRRRWAGVDPTVYTSESEWPAVRQAFTAAGVAEPNWWIAAYPGPGPVLYPGTVAHQFDNHGGAYDESVVADYWPGVDMPTPPHPVITFREGNMETTDPDTGGTWTVHPGTGAIECTGGAPYLGNLVGGRFDWPAVGAIAGIAARKDGAGQWGYDVAVIRPAPLADGAWFAHYLFPRDGSEANR